MASLMQSPDSSPVAASPIARQAALQAQGKAEDWEDYDDICTTYADQRKHVGLVHMLRFFAPSATKTILDAGCGTGNYTCSMLADFDHIYAGDFNAGMLGEAKRRVAQHADATATVEFAKLNICDMTDLEDASFDCSINCQVVHHLPKASPGGGADFAALQEACREWYRVLKPGGRLVINFVTHEQQMEAVWWGELIPAAVRRWQGNAPDLEDMRAAMQGAGFEVSFEGITESLYNDALYNDPTNFLDIDSFKRSDSTFALATSAELEEAVARVQGMSDSGVLGEWFQAKEAATARLGMTTNAYAVKPV